MSDPECTVCQNTSSPHSIPPHGTGRRDLTRLDEQRAAAPETTPGQAARDAFWEAARGDLAHTGDAWDWALGPGEGKGWEAAAKAGHAAIIAQQPATAARAAFEQVLRDEAGTIGRCRSAKKPCTFCEAGISRILAAYAVTEAERNDLRQALDERNAQLDAFTRVVHDVTDRPVLAGLAAALRTDAGMTFIDQFSKPEA